MDGWKDRLMNERIGKWMRNIVFYFFFYRELFHLLSQELVNNLQYALFQFVPTSGLYERNSESAINH